MRDRIDNALFGLAVQAIAKAGERAIAAHLTEAGLRLGSATWLVSARE